MHGVSDSYLWDAVHIASFRYSVMESSERGMAYFISSSAQRKLQLAWLDCCILHYRASILFPTPWRSGLNPDAVHTDLAYLGLRWLISFAVAQCSYRSSHLLSYTDTLMRWTTLNSLGISIVQSMSAFFRQPEARSSIGVQL
jgi:hypothetical protein